MRRDASCHSYPPESEVAALWASCVRVDADAEVRAWLESQRIDPLGVAEADLARAIPQGAILPEWAGVEHLTWASAGHRLVAPLVDARGTVRNLLARNVLTTRPRRWSGQPMRKALTACGFERMGLVLACGLARQVLASGALPEWFAGQQKLRVVISDGHKQWLIRAHSMRPACLGVEDGGWPRHLAARIPDGAAVFIATNPDERGARTATTIVQSFAERLRARTVRVELREEHELCTADGHITVRLRAES